MYINPFYMDTALKIAKMIVLLSVTLLCSAIGYEALQLQPVITQAKATFVKAGVAIDVLQASATTVNTAVGSINIAAKSANGLIRSAKSLVTGKVSGVLDRTSDTLDNVNRLCGTPGKSCGTLADFNRTLATVRGAVGQIEVAARHEDRNLGDFDAQEKQLYMDVHTTTANLNALVASPDVTRFLKASADTSIQVAAIATDVHKEADKLTAPVPWWHKIGNYTTTGVNVACLITHSCPF